VVLTKNSVSNISPTVHLSSQLGTNIQPKPLSGNPMVIKLVSNSSAIGKQNISGIVLFKISVICLFEKLYG
jgi:hypothetical protein